MRHMITKFAPLLLVLFGFNATTTAQQQQQQQQLPSDYNHSFVANFQTTTSPTAMDFFLGGQIGGGVDTSSMYYSVAAKMSHEWQSNICFVDAMIPPEVGAMKFCPNGKMEEQTCRDQCRVMMRDDPDDFTNCPLNLAGCCECGYSSFKFNNLDAGELYTFGPDTSNPMWTILPGWFNLAVWSLLTAGLVFLLVTRTTTDHDTPFPKARAYVTGVCRTIGLIGMILFALWGLIYLVGMNGLGYQFYFAFSLSRIGIMIHVIFASLWAISGVIQLIGPIRRRSYRWHRINGWICVVTTWLATIGLFILLLAPHQSALGGIMISVIFAIYWNVSLVLGVYYGIQRDINSHRRWMTRHMFVGSSVILGRIFNVLVEIVFKDKAWYVGSAFWDAACDNTGATATISHAEIVLTTGNSTLLNGKQMEFACNGISNLYDSYFFAVQFAVIMLVAGIFGAELWLWATGLQYSQQAISLTECTIPHHHQLAADLNEEDGGASSLRIVRQVQKEMPITLVTKEEMATDTVKLRFRLPRNDQAILIPLLGHVNLRKPGLTTSPRPYSPITSLERGYITFIVRRVPNGKLSTYMVQDMKVGDTLLLSGPMAPSLPDALEQAKSILLIAGGTGIVPFYSLMASTDASCHVLLSEKDQDRALPPVVGGSSSMMRNNSTISEVCLGRHKLQQRLDELICSEKEKEMPSMVLICGPPAFNIAIKSRVSQTGIPCFALGTDDR